MGTRTSARRRKYFTKKRSSTGGKRALPPAGKEEIRAPLIKLQHQIGNQAIQRIMDRTHQVFLKPAAVPGETTPEEKEKMTIALVNSLRGKKTKNKVEAGKIITSGLKAAFETPTGKRILKKAPIATRLFLLTGNLATWVATKSNILKIPDIPITKKLSLGAEVKGSPKKPSQVMFFLKGRF